MQLNVNTTIRKFQLEVLQCSIKEILFVQFECFSINIVNDDMASALLSKCFYI